MPSAGPIAAGPSGGRQIITHHTQATIQWFSPYPPPEILQGYDKVVPGFAERVVREVEKQSEHRQKLESQVVLADIKKSYLGMALGFVVALAGLAAAVVCVWHGGQVAGAVIGTVDLVALVGIFIYGSQQRRGERQERLQAARGEMPPDQHK